MIPLLEISRFGKFTETENRLEVTRNLGSYCSMGTDLHLVVAKTFQKWIVVMVAQHVNVINTMEPFTL